MFFCYLYYSICSPLMTHKMLLLVGSPQHCLGGRIVIKPSHIISDGDGDDDDDGDGVGHDGARGYVILTLIPVPFPSVTAFLA